MFRVPPDNSQDGYVLNPPNALFSSDANGKQALELAAPDLRQSRLGLSA